MAQVESLALAVRLPVVVRYFGELMSGIAVMIAVIAGAAFVLDDPALAARPGAAWAGVLLTGFAQRCRFNRISP